LDHLDLPSGLGTLNEVYKGKDPRVVILVQDAHAIPDAQRSIERLIGHLNQQTGVDYVGLEGAMGPLDPLLLKNFPDTERLNNIFEGYLDRGELSGAAAAAVMNPQEILYAGIEDAKLYEDEMEAFFRALPQQGEFSEIAGELAKELGRLKERYYSADLLELDRKAVALDTDAEPLFALLAHLVRLADTGKAVRADAAAYPRLTAVLESVRKEILAEENPEAHFELEKDLRTEIDHLLKVIESEGLPQPLAAAFNQKLQEFRTEQVGPEDFLKYLHETGRRLQLSNAVSGKVRELLERQELLRSMKAARLFEELGRYLVSVKEAFFRSEIERRLDRTGRLIALLSKTALLRLSFEEWQELAGRVETAQGDDEIAAIERTAGELWRLLDTDLSGFKRFYELALKRDEALLRNLLKGMDEEAKPAAIAVTGGFHAEGLKKALRDLGISYAVIAPTIAAVPKDPKYLDYMQGRVSWQDYYEVRNGRIDLFRAFHRAVLSKLDSGALLKPWRDRVLAALAARGRSAEASRYTGLIDEAALRLNDPKKFEALQKEWLGKVNAFVENLRGLREGGRLDPGGMLAAAKAATAAQVTAAGGFVRDYTMPAGWWRSSEEKPAMMGLRERLLTNPPVVAPLAPEAAVGLESARNEVRVARASPGFPIRRNDFEPYLGNLLHRVRELSEQRPVWNWHHPLFSAEAWVHYGLRFAFVEEELKEVAAENRKDLAAEAEAFLNGLSHDPRAPLMIQTFAGALAAYQRATREMREDNLKRLERERREEEAGTSRPEARALSDEERAVFNRFGQGLVDFAAAREAYDVVGNKRWLLSDEQALIDEGPYDLLLVLGSAQDRVAHEAGVLAQKLLQNNPDMKIMTSGKWGLVSRPEVTGVYLNEAGQRITEAEHFASVMEKYEGVQVEWMDTRSTDSGKNILYSRRILDQNGFRPRKVLILQTPTLQKRAGVTFLRQYPNPLEFIAQFEPDMLEGYVPRDSTLASLGIETVVSYAPYIPQVAELPEDEALTVVKLAFGELERLVKYAGQFTEPVEIPEAVKASAQKVWEVLAAPELKAIFETAFQKAETPAGLADVFTQILSVFSRYADLSEDRKKDRKYSDPGELARMAREYLERSGTDEFEAAFIEAVIGTFLPDQAFRDELLPRLRERRYGRENFGHEVLADAILLTERDIQKSIASSENVSPGLAQKAIQLRDMVGFTAAQGGVKYRWAASWLLDLLHGSRIMSFSQYLQTSIQKCSRIEDLARLMAKPAVVSGLKALESGTPRRRWYGEMPIQRGTLSIEFDELSGSFRWEFAFPKTGVRHIVFYLGGGIDRFQTLFIREGEGGFDARILPAYLHAPVSRLFTREYLKNHAAEIPPQTLQKMRAVLAVLNPKYRSLGRTERAELRTAEAVAALDEDPRWQLLKSSGFEVVKTDGELTAEQIVEGRYGSDMSPTGPGEQLEHDAALTSLSRPGDRPKVIALPYVNLRSDLQWADDEDANTSPEITPELLERLRLQFSGRLLVRQAGLNGMNSLAESKFDYEVVPYVYADPAVLQIVDRYREVWSSAPNGPIQLAKARQALLENILKHQGAEVAAKIQSVGLPAILADGFWALHYTSSYGNDRAFKIFMKALFKSRGQVGHTSNRANVVFTFLNSKVVYKKKFKHHGKLLDMLRKGSAADFGGRFYFYDLNPANGLVIPEGVPDRDSVLVINLQSINNEAFELLHYLSDAGVIAGDIGLNNALTFAAEGVAGTNFFAPHPGSQVALLNQMRLSLETNLRAKLRLNRDMERLVADKLRLFDETLGAYLTVQQPGAFTTQDADQALVDTMAGMFSDVNRGIGYREMFRDIVSPEGNMYNYILSLIAQLSNPASDRRLSVPHDFGPMKISLEGTRVLLVLQQAITGFGDARRIAALYETLKGSIKNPNDVLIFLADRDNHDLEEGLKRLEKVIDMKAPRFLLLLRDGEGRLRNGSDSKPLYVILENTKGRSEMRALSAVEARQRYLKDIETGRATFVMLKPDAVERGMQRQILDELTKIEGAELIELDPIAFSQEAAEQFYQVHRLKGFYGGLVKYLSRGKAVPYLIRLPEGHTDAVAQARSAIDRVRALPGAVVKNSDGIDENLIHGSDSPENAAYELTVVAEAQSQRIPSVAVIGLDNMGYQMARHYASLGANVRAVDSEPRKIRHYTRLLQRDAPAAALNGTPGSIRISAGGESLLDTIRDSDVIVLNVALRNGDDPKQYRERLFRSVEEVNKSLAQLRASGNKSFKLFVVRSVVPFPFKEGEQPETQYLENLMGHNGVGNFEMIYQPVFVPQDPSPEDLRNEQFILGTKDGAETVGTRLMSRLFARAEGAARLTTVRSAELAHYFIAIYLAKKLSHFNQIPSITHALGFGDPNAVALVAGLDKRVGIPYAKIGPGFGAWLRRIVTSVRDWLEDDLQAESALRPYKEKLLELLNAILDVNAGQMRLFEEIIDSELGRFGLTDLRGKTVGFLGIANRAKSSRVRDSVILELVPWLKKNAVKKVVIYDPYVSQSDFVKWLASERRRDPLLRTIEFRLYRDKREAEGELKTADLAIVGTPHPEIAQLSPSEVVGILGEKPLFDSWNIYGLQTDGSQTHSLREVQEAGLNYVSLGRKPVGPVFGDAPIFESRMIRSAAEIAAPKRPSKRVAVIGTGYVGLVTLAEFAELGHRVTGLDTDAAKIDILQQGGRVIYEPGLDELLAKHREETKRLTFTTDYASTVRENDIFYIAVGTPSAEDGSNDLRYVAGVAQSIGKVIRERKAAGETFERPILVIKSTVTPEAFDLVIQTMRAREEAIVQEMTAQGLELNVDYALASNPEFLREGTALVDVQRPDRIALGVDSRMSPEAIEETQRELLELFRPRLLANEAAITAGDKTIPAPTVVLTDAVSAPLGKYFANGFLASDITFSDVCARIAKALGGNWSEIAEMMRRDPRISFYWFREVGAGYGGSCFPKDVKALVYYMGLLGLPAAMLNVVIQINDWIKKVAFVNEIVRFVAGAGWDSEGQPEPLKGKKIAIWGVAFKADTDDTREAPSLDVIPAMIRLGATVVAHDPEAQKKFEEEILKTVSPEEYRQWVREGKFRFVSDPYEAAQDSDAIVLLTNWQEYAPQKASGLKGIDLERLRQTVKVPRVIAGRPLYKPEEMQLAGFGYSYIGGRDVEMARAELRTDGESRSGLWNRFQDWRFGRQLGRAARLDLRLESDLQRLGEMKRRDKPLTYDRVNDPMEVLGAGFRMNQQKNLEKKIEADRKRLPKQFQQGVDAVVRRLGDLRAKGLSALLGEINKVTGKDGGFAPDPGEKEGMTAPRIRMAQEMITDLLDLAGLPAGLRNAALTVLYQGFGMDETAVKNLRRQVVQNALNPAFTKPRAESRSNALEGDLHEMAEASFGTRFEQRTGVPVARMLEGVIRTFEISPREKEHLELALQRILQLFLFEKRRQSGDLSGEGVVEEASRLALSYLSGAPVEGPQDFAHQIVMALLDVPEFVAALLPAIRTARRPNELNRFDVVEDAFVLGWLAEALGSVQPESRRRIENLYLLLSLGALEPGTVGREIASCATVQDVDKLLVNYQSRLTQLRAEDMTLALWRFERTLPGGVSRPDKPDSPDIKVTASFEPVSKRLEIVFERSDRKESTVLTFVGEGLDRFYNISPIAGLGRVELASATWAATFVNTMKVMLLPALRDDPRLGRLEEVYQRASAAAGAFAQIPATGLPDAGSKPKMTLAQSEVDAFERLYAYLAERDSKIPRDHVAVVLGNLAEDYPDYAFKALQALHSQKIVIVGLGGGDRPEWQKIRDRILRLDPALGSKILVDENDQSLNTLMNMDTLVRILKREGLTPADLVLIQMPTSLRVARLLFEKQWQGVWGGSEGQTPRPVFHSYAVDRPFTLKADEPLEPAALYYLEHMLGQFPIAQTLADKDIDAALLEAERVLNAAVQRIDKDRTGSVQAPERTEMRSVSEERLWPEDEPLLDGVGEHDTRWHQVNLIGQIMLEKLTDRQNPWLWVDLNAAEFRQTLVARLTAAGIDPKSVDYAKLAQKLYDKKLLATERRDGHDVYKMGSSVDPATFAVKVNHIRYIQNDFLTALADLRTGRKEHLESLLKSYAAASAHWPLYPVESRYPVLKAIHLMDRDSRSALVKFILESESAFAGNPLVDAIALSFAEDLPEAWFDGWLDRNAANLKGRVIYYISPETWLAEGGLGRVSQNHTIAVKKLIAKGARIVTIEPKYPVKIGIRDKTETAIDYAKAPVPVRGLTRVPEMDFKIRVWLGDRRDWVTVKVYKGTNDHGIEVYMFEDENNWFVKALYKYGSEYGSGRLEHFAHFMSKCAIKIQKQIEKQAADQSAGTYRPGIGWANDGQSAFYPLLKRISDDLDALPEEEKQIIRSEKSFSDILKDPASRAALYSLLLKYVTDEYSHQDAKLLESVFKGDASQEQLESWLAPDNRHNEARVLRIARSIFEGQILENADLLTDPEREASLADNGTLMVTHTFKNRGFNNVNMIPDFRIPKKYAQYLQVRIDYTEPKQAKIDLTQAGIAAADIGAGVAAMHVQSGDQIGLVGVPDKDPKDRYDNSKHKVAITNGGSSALYAVWKGIFSDEASVYGVSLNPMVGAKPLFDKTFQSMFPGADPLDPTVEQYSEARRRAKLILKHHPRFVKGTDKEPPLAPVLAEIDEEAPVVGFFGRNVVEKAGWNRAFTEANLKWLAEKGSTVLWFANVQTQKESGAHFTKMVDLAEEINASARKNGWKGRIVVVDGWNIPEQAFGLAATDIQVNDSDPLTEAAGATETPALGIEITLPAPEGIYQQQGEIWSEKVGNVLIVREETAQAYQDTYQIALSEFQNDRETFVKRQIIALRFKGVADALPTAAEYLRQMSLIMKTVDDPLAVFAAVKDGQMPRYLLENPWFWYRLMDRLRQHGIVNEFPGTYSDDVQSWFYAGPAFGGEPVIINVELGRMRGYWEAAYSTLFMNRPDNMKPLLSVFGLDEVPDDQRIHVVDVLTGERLNAAAPTEISSKAGMIQNGIGIGIRPRDRVFQIVTLRKVEEAVPAIRAELRTFEYDDEVLRYRAAQKDIPRGQTVAIRFPKEVRVDRVFLAGDFNGWNSHADPLRPLGDGLWAVVVPETRMGLGEHKVKFVVNYSGGEVKWVTGGYPTQGEGENPNAVIAVDEESELFQQAMARRIVEGVKLPPSPLPRILNDIPISALRSRDQAREPGIGKVGDLTSEFLDQESTDVAHILPHHALAPGGQSPYGCIDWYSVNEANINLADAEELKDHPRSAALLPQLIAAPAKRARTDYEDVRRREEPVKFEMSRQVNGARRALMEAFIRKWDKLWLNDYAEFISLREIIGKPFTAWQNGDEAQARRSPGFAERVAMHKYMQWLGTEQGLTPVIVTLEEAGKIVMLDHPMFASVDSVLAWKHPEYFKPGYPGVVRKNKNWDGSDAATYEVQEEWKDLLLWNWTKLREVNYEPIFSALRYALTLGNPSEGTRMIRLDAQHFAWNFGRGQLASGDEDGQHYTRAVARHIRKYGGVAASEAYEEKEPDIRREGIIPIPSKDWWRTSDHDNERADTPRLFWPFGVLRDDMNTALFSAHPLIIAMSGGHLLGPVYPRGAIKQMVQDENGNRFSVWDWRFPVETDENYWDGIRFNLRPYFQHRTRLARAAKVGKVWTEPDSLMALLAYDAGRFVRFQPDGTPSITEIHEDVFRGESNPANLTPSFGLLLSRGDKESMRAYLAQFERSIAHIFGIFDERNELLVQLRNLTGGADQDEQRRSLRGKIEQHEKDLTAAHFERFSFSQQMIFMRVLERYVEASGDWSLAETMMPVLKEMMSHARLPKELADLSYEGYGLALKAVTDENGLVATPRTVYTERAGKLVENNARWYANLRFMEKLEDRFAGPGAPSGAADYRALADRMLPVFNQRFWNASEHCLYDVIDAESYAHGDAVAPYQIYAISDGADLLDADRQALIFARIEADLWTPLGLRGLPPRDGRYDESSPVNGAAHPVFLEPYMEALARVREGQHWTELMIRGEIERKMTPMAEYVALSPSGAVAQIFNGGTPQQMLQALAGQAALNFSASAMLGLVAGVDHAQDLALSLLNGAVSKQQNPGAGLPQHPLGEPAWAESTAAVLSVFERHGLVDRQALHEWARKTTQPDRVEILSVTPVNDGSRHVVRARVHVSPLLRPEDLTVQIWTNGEPLQSGDTVWTNPFALDMSLVPEGASQTSQPGGAGSFFLYEGVVPDRPGQNELNVRAAAHAESETADDRRGDNVWWEFRWAGGNHRLQSANVRWNRDSSEAYLARAVGWSVRYDLKLFDTWERRWTDQPGFVPRTRFSGTPELWAGSFNLGQSPEWFHEQWMRDVFESITGALVVFGRDEEAKQVFRFAAQFESGGILPNRIWDPAKALSEYAQNLLQRKKTLLARNEEIMRYHAYVRRHAGPPIGALEHALRAEADRFDREIESNRNEILKIDEELPPNGLNYNTADASLWFIHALQKYSLFNPDDHAFILEMLPVVQRILDGYLKPKDRLTASFYHDKKYQVIYTDDDGLLVTPEQATWMDAQPHDQPPVTRRNGKVGALNALLQGALALAEKWTRLAGNEEQAARYRRAAQKNKTAFNQKMRNPKYATGEEIAPFYDVIEGDPHEGALRSDIVLLAGRGGDLLSDQDKVDVVMAATKYLLAPHGGLRTLAAEDDHYVGNYRALQDTGNSALKDAAYHQGTVWPKTIKDYLEAVKVVWDLPAFLPHRQKFIALIRKIFGGLEKDDAAVSFEDVAARVLSPELEFLRTSPTHSLPEVWDGGDKAAVIAGRPYEQRPGGHPSQTWSNASVAEAAVLYGVLDPTLLKWWAEADAKPYAVVLEPFSETEPFKPVPPIRIQAGETYKGRVRVYIRPGIETTSLEVSLLTPRFPMKEGSTDWGETIRPVPLKPLGPRDHQPFISYEFEISAEELGLAPGSYQLQIRARHRENLEEQWLLNGNVSVEILSPARQETRQVPFEPGTTRLLGIDPRAEMRTETTDLQKNFLTHLKAYRQEKDARRADRLEKAVVGHPAALIYPIPLKNYEGEQRKKLVTKVVFREDVLGPRLWVITSVEGDQVSLEPYNKAWFKNHSESDTPNGELEWEAFSRLAGRHEIQWVSPAKLTTDTDLKKAMEEQLMPRVISEFPFEAEDEDEGQRQPIFSPDQPISRHVALFGNRFGITFLKSAMPHTFLVKLELDPINTDEFAGAQAAATIEVSKAAAPELYEALKMAHALAEAKRSAGQNAGSVNEASILAGLYRITANGQPRKEMRETEPRAEVAAQASISPSVRKFSGRVLQALAEGKRQTLAGLADTFGQLSPAGFERIAFAMETEAVAYAPTYAARKMHQVPSEPGITRVLGIAPRIEMGTDGAAIDWIRDSETVEALRQRLTDFDTRSETFMQELMSQVRPMLRDYFARNPRGTVFLGFPIAYDAKSEAWLMQYQKTIAEAQREFGQARVRGHVAVMVTPANEEAARNFLAQPGAKGIKLIEIPDEAGGVVRIQQHLLRNPNSLVYGLSEVGIAPEKLTEADARARVVESQASIHETVPAAVFLDILLAASGTKVTPDLLKNLFERLPGFAFTDRPRITAEAALQLVYERYQISQFIATNA